jgi:hypothetical protein
MRGHMDFLTMCLRASRAAFAQRRPVLWSSLIFLLVFACQWCALSARAPWVILVVGLRSTVKEVGGLDDRWTSLWSRKCEASGLVHF